MFKRNGIAVSILSGSALVMICLLAGVITAQKGPNATTGAPLRGVDVKLGSNPGGNAAARVLHASNDGRVDLSFLTPGSYWLEIEPLTEAQKAANAGGGDYTYLTVTISGTKLVGGEKTRSWSIAKQQFASPPPKNMARTTAASETYTNRLVFDIGPETGGREASGHSSVGPFPKPCFTAIVKSKSNIANN